MAEVGAWLRKVVLGYYDYAATHLQASRVQAMAEYSGPPQPARRDALGTTLPQSWTGGFLRRVLHSYPDARLYATHPS
jgi:hypothetical protein